MRLNNARVIADIEYVIEPPSQAADFATWSAFGVSCQRDRHRYGGQDYAFQFDVMQLHHGAARRRWRLVVISELWRFKDVRAEPRTLKSLRLLSGKAGDVLAWMRESRELKLKRGGS